MAANAQKQGARQLASAAASLLLLVGAGGLLSGPVLGQAPGAPRIPGQNPNGLRVFLWTGLKTHAPGQHDYPQFLADWSKLLTERGAVVRGALHTPTREDLEKSDVVVIYKGDVGYLTDTDKAALEAYVQRGGGLVSLHDALCGPDPAYLSKLLGGAKKHGEVNFTLEAPVPYTVADKAHPIMKDMTSGFTLLDEAFFNMTWALGTRHPRAGDSGDRRRRAARASIAAKRCRSCGRMSTRSRAGRRLARSSGCKGTITRIFPITRSSGRCCGESRGRRRSRRTSWWITWLLRVPLGPRGLGNRAPGNRFGRL